MKFQYAKSCTEKISEEIKHTNFLTVIPDETSNGIKHISGVFSFRDVVNDRPKERFRNFITLSQHHSEILAAYILAELSRLKSNEHSHKLIAQLCD